MQNFLKFLITLTLLIAAPLVLAQSWHPYCYSHQKNNNHLIVAYLGADSHWQLSQQQEQQLKEALQHVSLVNYAFVRFTTDADGNTVLNLSPDDLNNINEIRKLRADVPIILSVGGWGGRGSFQPILENPQRMAPFVQSVFQALQQYHLDGIDIDWENEQLAPPQDLQGLVTLFNQLHEQAANTGYCVSNAVPGTPAYWNQYPAAASWQQDVNWTTIMAYDNYGTFGPNTELGASLFASDRNNELSNHYPYPTTSGNLAVKHYHSQGLPAQKIVLGLPFYCHSYYINDNDRYQNSSYPGLHVPVLDPNISSQVDYQTAYQTYGERLFQYSLNLGNDEQAITYYGLIAVPDTSVTRFLSCDGPQSVLDKISYVKRHHLTGVSFWSLSQDLPYSHPMSLLRAINQGFTTNEKK